MWSTETGLKQSAVLWRSVTQSLFLDFFEKRRASAGIERYHMLFTSPVAPQDIPILYSVVSFRSVTMQLSHQT